MKSVRLFLWSWALRKTSLSHIQDFIDFAKPIDVDGFGLYVLSVSTWEKELGIEGKGVYDHIHASKWGRVSLTSLRTHVEAIVLTLTLEQPVSHWPYVNYMGIAITFFIILIGQKKKRIR